MRHLVLSLCIGAGLLAACQRIADHPLPATPDGAARAAAKPTTCSTPLTVKIKSSVKDMDRLYLFEAMYVGRNGNDSAVAGSAYQDLINGDQLTFSKLAYDKPVRLRLYENEQDKTKFVSSGTFASCGQGGAEFDLRSFKLSTTPTPVTFQVKFPCADVEPKKVPATVAVEFRPVGTSQWLPLLTLKREDVKKNLLVASTYRVVKGKAYDVRMNVFFLPLSQNNTLVSKDVLEVPVNTSIFCK